MPGEVGYRGASFAKQGLGKPLWAAGQCWSWVRSPEAFALRLADDPEVQVLHSVGHSAAPRLFPLVWAVLLLPFLLLQTP